MTTPNSTKAELSAPEQRDISPYQATVQRIAWCVYGRGFKVLSRPTFAKHLTANLIVHSFYPVGDDLHVAAITIDRYLLGHNRSIETFKASELRSSWLPIWGLENRHLILGSCLFADVKSVLELEERKRYLVRLSKALWKLKFPQPSGEKSMERAYRQHHFDLQRQGGAA